MANDEMTIRPATQGDTAQIVRLVYAAYVKYLDRMEKPPAPMLADYTELIAHSDVYVLASRTEIAGVLVIEARDQTLLIENVAVDPAFQGQGLGQRLMVFAERYARERELREVRLYTNEVMAENLAFYQRLGFEEVERRVDGGYRRVFLRKLLVG
ncbi:MAG TPA: GNAT family N-acetyltransferase [Ktedonobacterales bacterium]|jgi:ribosomal protein S18 acetylase RimI-like enzyme